MLGKILRELENHSKWDIWMKQSFVATKSWQPKTWMSKVLQISVKYLCIMYLFQLWTIQCGNVVRFQHRTQQSCWVRPQVNAWPNFRHVKFQIGTLSTRIISYIESCQFWFTVFNCLFMLILISVLNLNPLIHKSRSPSYLIPKIFLMFNLPTLSLSPLCFAMFLGGHSGLPLYCWDIDFPSYPNLAFLCLVIVFCFPSVSSPYTADTLQKLKDLSLSSYAHQFLRSLGGCIPVLLVLEPWWIRFFVGCWSLVLKVRRFSP